jgi:hypothetical protein
MSVSRITFVGFERFVDFVDWFNDRSSKVGMGWRYGPDDGRAKGGASSVFGAPPFVVQELLKVVQTAAWLERSQGSGGVPPPNRGLTARG